jgi:hypothetical protein
MNSISARSNCRQCDSSSAACCRETPPLLMVSGCTFSQLALALAAEQLLLIYLVDVHHAVAACHQDAVLAAPGNAEHRPACGHNLQLHHS